MNSIQVLDVTLRDGGCVNNFNFGTSYINKILFAQEQARVDIIELGYLDAKDGSESGRTKYLDEKVIYQSVLTRKQPNIEYVVMMDYGKFNVEKIEQRNERGVDGIRVAFHKADCHAAISVCRTLIKKGYKVYIQPMVILRYSDLEIIELIQDVNEKLSEAAGFYIVDSFGEMRTNDMERILNLVDHNLISSMKIGFHSHNNLQMSYSNAIFMIQYQTSRDIIIDSSIMGMGKGAGNLNTELLLEHLNLYYGKSYMVEPLLEVMDTVINQLHEEFYWGYAPEYYLSAINHCTPSYASYFYNKHMLSIDHICKLLKFIDEDKKISFDEVYAENLYRQYNENESVNDSHVLKMLQQIFKGRTVLLVAPGKSMVKEENRVREIAGNINVITVGVNTLFDFNDYIIATREDIVKKAIERDRNLIVPSNVIDITNEKIKVVNYADWIEIDEKIHDSSTVIILNLLKYCEVKTVMMAGFDGFSMNINENYYDDDMRRPMTAKQAHEKNEYYINFISKMRKNGMNIEFVTETLFDI